MGQHFLSDPAALERIVDTLDPGMDDTVVEIGPGRGALTRRLLQRAGSLVAVELDKALAAMLEREFADSPRVRIVQADVLKVDLGQLGGDGYLLVGNVPYYITTPILFHALSGLLPRRAVFLVQREVAERATSAAGSRGYGALSVNLQVLTRVESVFDVPPGAFTPPPSVQSSVICMEPLTAPLIMPHERRAFQVFVQAVFSQRRKQLGTILRSVVGNHGEAWLRGPDGPFQRLDLDPSIRPERLAPSQFVELFAAVGQGKR